MPKELERSLGVLAEKTPEAYAARQQRLRRYINLQLIASGLSPVPLENASPTAADAEEMLGAFRERLMLLDDPAARPIGGSSDSCTSILPNCRASRHCGCRSGP